MLPPPETSPKPTSGALDTHTDIRVLVTYIPTGDFLRFGGDIVLLLTAAQKGLITDWEGSVASVTPCLTLGRGLGVWLDAPLHTDCWPCC